MMQSVMHVYMIVIAIAIAFCMRGFSRYSLSPARSAQLDWSLRWTKALSTFLVPPLFLLMTAIAIVTMGASSCHAWEGYLSYGVALSFVLFAAATWLQLIWQVVVSQRALGGYASKMFYTPIGPVSVRLIDTPFAFSAQVGFWSPVLVISRSIVDCLTTAQLTAVFAHEQGHAHYKDTFWFFWLGGLRKLTGWLPGTQDLWQELLLLRELRADRWAARSVDKLVLAESLMRVVSMQQNMQNTPLAEGSYAAFSMPAASPSRLAQRIEALLSENAAEDSDTESKRNLFAPTHLSAIAWSFTPLLTIPFHR